MHSRKSKVILSFIGCLFLSSSALAAQWGDFTYTESGGKIQITDYTGSGGDVVIPDTIEGMPVFRIASNAFESNISLTGVTIPDGITIIDQGAFYRCTSLTSVTIPGSVAIIDTNVFSRCTGLTSVTISNGITRIRGAAFNGCTGLTSLTIPGSVTNIGEDYTYTQITGAFEGCTGLTNLTLMNGVTNIGYNAFRGCSGLTSVIIPSSVKYIADVAFEGCSSLTAAYFYGDAPIMEYGVFYNCASDFTVYYTFGSIGFSSPWWDGYPAKVFTPSPTNKCPAQTTLGDNNPNLKNLRAFRDKTLAKSAIGRKVIQIYYSNTDSINAALDSNPALRAVTRRVLEVIAPMVGDKG